MDIMKKEAPSVPCLNYEDIKPKIAIASTADDIIKNLGMQKNFAGLPQAIIEYNGSKISLVYGNSNNKFEIFLYDKNGGKLTPISVPEIDCRGIAPNIEPHKLSGILDAISKIPVNGLQPSAGRSKGQ